MTSFLGKLFSRPPEQQELQDPPHIHAFDLIAKTIAEPQGVLKNPDGYIIPSVALGCTTYLWQCSCGETKKEVLSGSEDPLLATILRRVDTEGPVTIVHNEKKYLVGVVSDDQKPLHIR
jgi:hypothetical protein